MLCVLPGSGSLLYYSLFSFQIQENVLTRKKKGRLFNPFLPRLSYITMSEGIIPEHGHTQADTKIKHQFIFTFSFFFCLNHNIRSNLSSAKNGDKLNEVTNRQCNNLLKAGNKSGRVSFGWMVPALNARTGRLPSELLSRLSWLPVPQSAAT